VKCHPARQCAAPVALHCVGVLDAVVGMLCEMSRLHIAPAGVGSIVVTAPCSPVTTVLQQLL
jgi:hypothetical protein